MADIVRMHRQTLSQMLRSDWTEFWIATPRISADATALLLPLLRRPGARVRVLTDVDAAGLAAGRVEYMALEALRSLPDCEVRSLPELGSSLYMAGPAGPALVTAATLSVADLDSDHILGVLLPDGGALAEQYERWWEAAGRAMVPGWVHLAAAASQQQGARALGDEIARVGAFVRVSVRGTRRTRRLDPREFGAPDGDWGRLVRPVEVALYKLDDVIRAREDLEEVLAEHGLEWNGYYLVPRHFLDRDWPRLFEARERQLRERLNSPEGQASLKTQLAQTRRELEAFFAELFPRVQTQGQDATTWIEVQVTRVLTEAMTDTVLQDSGLEYRVLTILPEDVRSVGEIARLLQDPKLRSVQLTFNF